MIVYRIEHRTERHGASGHYHGPFGDSQAAWAYTSAGGRDPRLMPTPNGEGLCMEDKMICSFHSWEELFHWFGHIRGREVMEQQGFCIRSYYTDDYEQARVQTIFNAKTATPVKMYDLNTLEPIE